MVIEKKMKENVTKLYFFLLSGDCKLIRNDMPTYLDREVAQSKLIVSDSSQF
jgi:hypothetical protein